MKRDRARQHDEPARPPGEGGFGRREFLKGGLFSVVLLSVGGLKACDSDGDGDGDGGGGGEGDSGRPVAPAAADDRIPIIWIETAVCTGCGVSLLNATDPSIADLMPAVRFEFQETLMDHYGAVAVDRIDEVREQHPGGYVLVVDGAIATGATSHYTVVGEGSDGHERLAADLVKELAADAAHVVAVGTCASWGGIPSAAPNPGGYGPLAAAVDGPVIRIPGCPAHPAWVAGALTALLAGEAPELDDLGRPTAFFGQTVHDLCPRQTDFKSGNYASAPGEDGCLLKVGCKGPIARADCPTQSWNDRSHCIEVGHPCIACVAPGFPDARADAGGETSAASPFYDELG